jgi:inorganic pyrophosphatase
MEEHSQRARRACLFEIGVHMRIDAIPIGKNPPHDINVVVEVPIGGEPIKYELDKQSGTLFVDRMLYTAMRYPGNYGFIPHTLSDDGDPVDVLIANNRPIVPGAVCNCRPVGVIYMEDESGGDEKIIAVPSDKVSAIYKKIRTYEDLPEMLIARIAHFFEHYKDLERGKWVKIVKWGGDTQAHEMILRGIEAAKKQKEPADIGA